MSRVKRKKAEKRLKRFFRLFLILEMVLLVYGLLAVDFAVKDMLGLYESSLIKYSSYEADRISIQIMGKDYLLDLSNFKSKINNRFAQFEEMIYNIKGQIEVK